MFANNLLFIIFGGYCISINSLSIWWWRPMMPENRRGIAGGEFAGAFQWTLLTDISGHVSMALYRWLWIVGCVLVTIKSYLGNHCLVLTIIFHRKSLSTLSRFLFKIFATNNQLIIFLSPWSIHGTGHLNCCTVSVESLKFKLWTLCLKWSSGVECFRVLPQR